MDAALADLLRIQWYESFDAMAGALGANHAAAAVIVDAVDPSGAAAAPVASRITHAHPGVSIILYATRQDLLGGALASPAFSDLVVAGETDGRIFVRDTVLGVVKRRAADRVMAALRQRLPSTLLAFADAAVRYPACATVEALAVRIGVHRQTAAVWCRKEKFLRPEELLIWARLLLVAALLEDTEIPVGTVAVDLEFPSVVALRNQLKRYTGMTALEIRQAGLDAVLSAFDHEVDRARGSPREAAPAQAGLPLPATRRV
jgi:AraC-like DNA-binding protein